MAPWASKPRGPVAQGNGANHGCRLAVAFPPPLSLRTVVAKRRLTVANCGSGDAGEAFLLVHLDCCR